MFMSVFVDHYLSRTRAAEHLVEDWKNKHDQAMFAMDVEEMVRECVNLDALCRHAWKTLWQLIRRDPNGAAVDEAKEPIQEALAKTQQVLHSVEGLVAEAKGKGLTISSAEELLGVARTVREISAKVKIVYPNPNWEQIRISQAEFERGEYQTIEELLREVQGERPA
jgi:hypothetical protein